MRLIPKVVFNVVITLGKTRWNFNDLSESEPGYVIDLKS